MHKRLFVLTVVAIALGTIVFAGLAHHRILRAMAADKVDNAFDSYMVWMPGLLQHHGSYTDDTFPLPPFALLFVAPLTSLPRPAAQVVWVVCKPFFFLPIFLLCLSMVRRAGRDVPWPALLLIALAWLFPVLGDAQEGQMNLLMLLPLTLALWFAQNDSRRGNLFAGLFLAMAICIKVTPLAFVPYFLFRRRWELLLWTAAGMLLWLLAVPALFFGWDQNLTWLHQWFDIMIGPYVMHSAIKYSNGESIPELVTRLFSHAPAWTAPNPTGQSVSHYMNVLKLSQDAVHAIGRILLAAIGLAGLWWARHPIKNFRSRQYLLEIGCVACFMLWASERTWVHHYVTLILPLMAAGMIAGDPRATPASRKAAWLALAAAALLIPCTSDLGNWLIANGRHYVESLDFVLLASLALALAITTASFLDTTNGEPASPSMYYI